ncbi:MFS transporter [Salmonella enterica subsp. enterica serovar Newport]|uniref:MFS transporter n=1 Tax=Salmonella newport TaxID=108619 RepID=A0A5Y0RZD2_SALNE|nr:aromatic acid/H+ symport family MFS transporter [Salmonella enterica subsp. enterica serovar Newport]EBS4408971.1 aromatic acid/H+ symport family MFS transporter [Salmonella enterica subsp. enterica serovar Newport]ECB7109199.1 MFS transporter [Salmonella enterica subsp. enterica serovar Newport]ECF2111291.1 MFS transporter [Salmonella enterica subsp. enterica serovar Newport]ECJ3621742.1 aromatic acid/H+ symport family MFS transporter [Salmonella enterica subsp. enterica serovar Newport]
MKISDEGGLWSYLESQPLNKFHIILTIICLLILTLDGFDMTIMGFVAPSLMDEWEIGHDVLGVAMSSGLLGLACGALVGGTIADQFGRKNVIFCAVLLFGVLSIASAWSPDIETLIILRFLTGLGLGAAQPNVATLIAEYAPVKYKSTLICIIYCGITLGSALVGFIAKEVIPAFGWEGVFIVGGILPIISLILIAIYLPESILYLLAKQKNANYVDKVMKRITTANDYTIEFNPARSDDTVAHQQAKFTPIEILKQPYLLCTLSLWLGLFMNLMCVNFLSNWMPLLIRESGFTLTDAALIGAIAQVGGTLGNIFIGVVMDRWGYHKTMFLGMASAVVFSLLLTQYHSTLMIIGILAFFLGTVVNSVNTGWTSLSAIYYPTKIRATGTSTMTAIGRTGAILGAFIGGLILATGIQAINMFYFLALPLFICAIAVLLNKKLITQ